MKRPRSRITINLWPREGTMFWLFVLTLVILCAGKPDIIDAVVHRIMDTPKQVETE